MRFIPSIFIDDRIDYVGPSLSLVRFIAMCIENTVAFRITACSFFRLSTVQSMVILLDGNSEHVARA